MTNEQYQEINDFVAKYMIRYFKEGVLESNSFLTSISDELRTTSDIIDMHFILNRKTVDFLIQLPELIKQFNCNRVEVDEISRGVISGHIDWDRTFRERMRNGANNNSIFAVSNLIMNEDIVENRVLHKIISTIYAIYEKYIDIFYANHEWSRDCINGIECIESIIENNSYLAAAKDYEIDERSMDRASKSKRVLYSMSAELLIEYNQYHNKRSKDVAELLAQTYIKAKDEDKLFELYWVFKLIDQNTRHLDPKNVSLNPIVLGNNCIAMWCKGKFLYKIYHNCGNTGKCLFSVYDKDLKPGIPYDQATLNALNRFNAFKSLLIGQSKKKSLIWEGRPDIIVEKYEKKTSKLVKIIIGEVKNSSQMRTTLKGLYELTQYMSYIRGSKESDLDKDVSVDLVGMVFSQSDYGYKELIFQGEKVCWQTLAACKLDI